MKRNNIDTKVPDFIWNQNRLMLEKERIKKEMMGVPAGVTPKLDAMTLSTIFLNQTPELL